jgi:hypothetical protein
MISFDVECSRVANIRHRVQSLAIAAHRYYRFCVRFFTSSSLTGCNMSLFGCPGVLPECPFDQSYDTAYAKIDPFRLNADEETGPGRGSNAVRTVIKKSIQDEARTMGSTFQACARVLVPEVDRPIRSCGLAWSKGIRKRARSRSYRTWRMSHVWDGN